MVAHILTPMLGPCTNPALKRCACSSTATALPIAWLMRLGSAGNTSLETLNLNLMGLTAGHANIATRKVYAGVMETFAVMLCSNSTLRFAFPVLKVSVAGGDYPKHRSNAICPF